MLPIFHLDEQQALAYLTNGLSNLSKQLLHRIPTGLGNMVRAFVNFAIMAFALFFFFKDGNTYVSTILGYLPFSERNKSRLSNQAKDVIVSTIYGGVAIAVAQGTLGS